MKLKLYLVVLALFVSACGFFGGPSSVAKNWISYVQDGKYEEAFKLFSSEYVKQKGADKVKTDMQQFHQEIESNKQRTGSFSIEKHNEIVEGNTARVHFIPERWR